MDDLISRADAMAYPLSWEHCDKKHGSREFISGVESYREYIEYLPSARPKRGEWIIDKEPSTQYGTIEFECSVCGMPYSNEHRKGAKIGWWFCPNCGADMRDVETIEYHKTLGDRWSGYGRKKR